MPEFVLLTGALVTALSLVLMLSPRAMKTLVLRVFRSRWLYAAALLRLLLGAGLLASANTVAWPLTIAVTGWLFVLGGLLLVVVPRSVTSRLAARLVAIPAGLARLALLLAALFGGFLIWVALA